MTLTFEERIARLDDYVARGAIVRGSWTDGHERACLLAALSPEVARAESSYACPADLMPMWFAELTVWIDDNGSSEFHPLKILRYQKIAHGFHHLSLAAWERLKYRSLRAIVIEARSHVNPKSVSVLSAIDRVASLADRCVFGTPPTREEWAIASAACVASTAARAWEADAMWAAAWASRAWEVARAVAWAAVAAVRAAQAASAQAASAQAASADRLITAIFEAFEDEISAAERGSK